MADRTRSQEKVLEQKHVGEYHGKHLTTIINVSKRGRTRVHVRGARGNQPLLTFTTSSSDDDPRHSSRGADARVHRRIRARRNGRRQITYKRDTLDHASDVSSGGELTIRSVGYGRFRFEQASVPTKGTVCAYFRNGSKNMAKDMKQAEKEFSQQVTDVVQQTTLSRSDVASRLSCTDNARLTSAPDSKGTFGNHFKTEVCLDADARTDSSQSDDFGSDLMMMSSGSRSTSSTTSFSDVFFHHTHRTNDNLGADANLGTEDPSGWSQTGAARYPAFAAGSAPKFTASNIPRTSSSTSSSSGEGETSTTLVSTSESDKSLVSMSFDGVLLSNSEVRPLVNFSKPWLNVLRQGRPESDDPLTGGLSAQEIRRRYSADQYKPLSPFARHRRHASNLSERDAPLFLRIQKRPPGPVRQLSLEIGEEWERVHSPRGLQLPAALPGGEISDVNNVFVWLSSSTTDTISKTRQAAQHSESTHSSDVRIRLPQNYGVCIPSQAAACCLAIKSSSSGRTPGVTFPSRPWAGGQLAATNSAALEQATGSSTSTLPGNLVPAEEVESSISLNPGEETPTSIMIVQPASTQCRGGCDHMAIPIDDADFEDAASVLADHKRHLLPNPYNRLNQRCHSTLHCPCCFFLCLLCCLPAVYFMVLSDLEFDFGSLLKARRYGRRTTKLYFAGASLAVTLLVTYVVCTAFFLPQTLVGPRAG